MARRRNYPIAGTSAPVSEADEIRARNQAAALAWQQKVEATKAGSVDESGEPARLALARALGEDPNTPAGPLMARFRSLPPNVQAGIYQRGGAHFIGGVEGSKMITSLAADKEKHLDTLTSQVAEQLANGKIGYDLDEQGKPAFYEMVDDQSKPGLGYKVKQPLNLLRKQMLQRGFEKGTIPNPFAEDTNQQPLLANTDPTKTGKMSAEAFQSILDARAKGLMTGPSGKPRMDMQMDVAPKLPPASPMQINPGWLDNGGPRRLMSEMEVTDDALGSTLRDTMGGIGNFATSHLRGITNFLLGDKVKAATSALTYKPSYTDPSAPVRPNPALLMGDLADDDSYRY